LPATQVEVPAEPTPLGLDNYAFLAGLKAKGIKTYVINHDDSARGAAKDGHEGTWIRSV
jgi:hypothetical protein